MKIVIWYLSLFFISSTILAQVDGWTNVSSTFGDMNSVIYCRATNEILIGTSDNIWASQFDEIKNLLWNKLDHGINDLKLNRLYEFENLIFACTEKGIYSSDDNGNSWNKTGLPDSNFRVLIYSENKILFTKAYPGNVYSSSDFGKTWVEKTYSTNDENIFNFHWQISISANTAGDIFVCLDSVSYLRSNDGGDSWDKFIVPVESQKNIQRLYVNGDQLFFRAGTYNSVQFYCSVDDGKNWNKITTPEAQSKHLYFYNDKLRLLTIKPGGQYESIDKGVTWKPISDVIDIINSTNISKDTIIAVAKVGFAGNILALSIDGGENWLTQRSSFNESDKLSLGYNNSIYSLSRWSGVFRSRNNGMNWEPVLNIKTVDDIAFAGSDCVVISSSLYGVYILTDDCKKITIASDHGLKDPNVTSLMATKEGVIFAGAYSNNVFFPHPGGGQTSEYRNGGLWRSTDLGNSWHHILLDNNYKTTDSGTTWLEYNEYSRSYNKSSNPDLTIHSMGINPDGNILVQASVGYRDRLFESSDQGTSWKMIDELEIYEEARTQFTKTPQGEIFSGIARSTDGGKTFEDVVDGIATNEINQVLPLFGGDVLAATSKGVYFLKYKSNTWSCLAFNNKDVKDIVFNGSFVFASVIFDKENSLSGVYKISIEDLIERLPSIMEKEPIWGKMNFSLKTGYSITRLDSDKILWAVKENEKKFKKNEYGFSLDGGNAWTYFVSPYEFIYDMQIDQLNECIWICCGDGLFRSPLKEIIWKKIELPMMKEDEYYFTTVNTILSDNSQRLMVLTNEGDKGKCYISTDVGKSWELSDTDLPTSAYHLFKSSKGKIFAALRGEGLYWSTDFGKSWTDCNNTLLPKDVLYMCNYGADADQSVGHISETSDGKIYVIRGARGIAYSDDEGLNWKYLESPSEYIYDILVTKESEIFAATPLGIYKSTNNGNSWETFSLGLTSSEIYNLVLDDEGYLMAHSSGGKIFRTVKKINQ